MRTYRAKQSYDPIVAAKRGKYFGDLKNPVSRPFVGAHGKVYRVVYVMNPMNGEDIDRVLISEDDVRKVLELREISITEKGEVHSRKNNKNHSSLEFFLYHELSRNIAHINGNILDFRRENISVIKPDKDGKYILEDIPKPTGYWNISFDGSTRTLISLCIRDNPNQCWSQLVKTVSEIKNCPIQETEKYLTEFKNQNMLGYHDGSEWKEWTGSC